MKFFKASGVSANYNTLIDETGKAEPSMTETKDEFEIQPLKVVY